MRVRTAIGAAVALVAALAMTAQPAFASSGVATSGLEIRYIYFDSPGSDTGSNHSLNAEWIRVRNNTSSTKNISGWTIRDAAGHVFTFGPRSIGPGDYATVHTGHGSSGSHDRYWQQSWYIWNNTGDTAYLRNASGSTVDTCSYSSSQEPERKWH